MIFFLNLFKFIQTFREFSKIINNKKIGAAPKIGEGGDVKHVFFFIWPNAALNVKNCVSNICIMYIV